MAHHNTRGKTTAAIQQFEHDAKHWKLCQDDFVLLKMIGEGGEGTVYHAKHIKSGLNVALKRIPYNQCFDNEQESRIHCQLVHPNIVRFYGMFRDDTDTDYDTDYDEYEYDDDNAKSISSTSSSSCCWIILEYCPEGTMLQVMQTTRFASAKAREAFCSNQVYKILQAVQYMHDEHQLMHRDIKPINLLWKKKKSNSDGGGGGDGEPVLADFGMCAELKSSSSLESESSSSKEHNNNNATGTRSDGGDDGPRNYEFIGTIPYMAPEVLALEPKYRAATKNNEEQGGVDGDDKKKNKEHDDDDDEWRNDGYSYKADCWSIGITTYELVTGMHPFPILDNDQQFTLAVRQHVELINLSPHSITFPDNVVSQEAKNFILSLVQVDPKKRMSINEALAHPWIRRHVKHQQPQQQHHATGAVAATMVSSNQDKENKPVKQQQQQQRVAQKSKQNASTSDGDDNADAVQQVEALLGGLDINKV